MKTIRHRIESWLAVCVAIGFVVVSAVAVAQMAVPPGPPAVEPPVKKDDNPRLKFRDTPLDLVLQEYCDKTGRTLLRSPEVQDSKITLQSQEGLTMDEYLQAIEMVLSMRGIALLKSGDKFLKVVPSAKAREESMPVRQNIPEIPLKESGELVSQMVPLKHIDTAEAQKIIQPLLHSAFGKVHPIERANTLLITETSENINRILDIIRYVDQPVEAREEPHIMKIRYAKAADIKRKLEEIIAESQKEAQKSTVPRPATSGGPGVVTPVPVTPVGVVRPRVPTPIASDVPDHGTSSAADEAERGIIRGKVQMVADDRTNLLIIITRKENIAFFEKIVKVLDVETEPGVIVKIIRLEYAKAENVASTLNTLIGSADKGKDVKSTVPPKPGEESRTSALREYVEQITTPSKPGEPQKSKIGELSSANIKILSDKRTNALLIMAPKADLAALEEIVTNMDMMLLQVLVEAVIIQVDLDDKVTSGMHWVQRALIVQEKKRGTVTPKGVLAGSAGSGSSSLLSASDLTQMGGWAGGYGLSGYFTHFGLNLDAIVSLVANDTRAQILTAPVIATTDNTKAKITSNDQKYFRKGSTVDQFGNVRPETELKDIGLELEITPHINRSRNVAMEISQTISDPGTDQTIGAGENAESWPTTKKNSFNATIAVQDRETIVLGGLVRNYKNSERKKVPILGDIPILGRLFRHDFADNQRREIVVFVTPYVMGSTEEATEESRRRRDALDVGGLWKKGWSDSKLAGGTGKNAGQDLKTREKALREREKVVSDKEKQLRQLVDEMDRVPATNAVPAGAAPASDAATKPSANLSPEMQRFIEQQNSRWTQTLGEIDRRIETGVN